MISLEKNEEITVKPSDKGGNIFVLDTASCKKMCLRILNDKDGYEVLPNNPTQEYRNELEALVDWGLANNLVDVHEHNFLLPIHPVVLTFYSLTKVHKGATPFKGRPIVSGISSLMQNVGTYLDKFLLGFVVSLLSYTRDTTDLLAKLESQ